VIVAQSFGLISVKVLISNSLVHLELFKDHKDNLFLSSPTASPKGVVYYATTLSLLYSFEENSITLQSLFDDSPSHFVEITHKNKKALYCLTDVDVQIICGNKKINELKAGNNLNISWTQSLL
jgi:hypothetical protein